MVQGPNALVLRTVGVLNLKPDHTHYKINIYKLNEYGVWMPKSLGKIKITMPLVSAHESLRLGDTANARCRYGRRSLAVDAIAAPVAPQGKIAYFEKLWRFRRILRVDVMSAPTTRQPSSIQETSVQLLPKLPGLGARLQQYGGRYITKVA